ncbi:PREDICTED: PI-PLC X domain-containing protein 3-like [Branchiostoma belcheri]|uniref:PI-PLC X domain-containing protein 3-like n=1 Tax=Branchiostoma belcheri TaxID=7741 RepID=A0A6P4YT53_BRABE|nr:PREDICTED: PI-PLC X domain-containing protein 3-like [Branchiostoma belcheri]
MSSMATDKSSEMDECKRNLLYLSKLDTRLGNWMGDLPPRLYNAPLKNLAIPGTHDSASVYLDITSDISPGEIKTIKDIIDSLAKIPSLGLEQIGKDVVYNWAVTQGSDFTEQLENGVRYFDLRVATGKSDSSLYFVHGLYGSKVESGLREIAEWLHSHPKEVVLLDFQHLYFGEKPQDENMITILKNTFGSMLCPKAIKGNAVDVTLANLWDNRYQVIVFYANEVAVTGHDILWTDKTYIYSPWANTPDISILINTFLDNESRKGSKFFVSQAILSPDTATILFHLCGNLKGKLAIPAMPKILHWLEGKKAGYGSSGLNIVIADFVDREFAQTVIKLNYPV